MIANVLHDWVAIGIAFVTLILVLVRDNKSNRKDIEEAVEKDDAKFDSIKEAMIKVNVKLDTLCNTANETRSDVKVTAKDITAIQQHMSVIDERLSNMDRRIRNLELNVFDKTVEE